MPKNSNYYSVSRAQWQHIGFNTVHKIRIDKLANQNEANTTQIDEKTKQPEQQLLDLE